MTAEQQIIAALMEANATIKGLRADHAAQVLPLADELNRIKQELHAEKLDPERPLKLSSDRAALQDQLATITRKEPAGIALRSARLGLLDELTKARARESQVRADSAARITARLSGRVEVAILTQGDRQRFTEDLRQVLQGSGASGSAIEAIAMTDGVDGTTLASLVAGRRGSSQTGPAVRCDRRAGEQNLDLADRRKRGPYQRAGDPRTP
ncbi:hypothetical protein [Micromonospora sp. NPDC005324]|uniref:hypothetical protein n=1 Tax=Micromonospora sp. NPDC005324 TaxID=3157033 RepID=UPI0033B572AA